MDEQHFCIKKWSLVLFSGTLFISVVRGQYVYNMPSLVYAQHKTDKFPNEPTQFGSLYLPVDGRNATLDCNNYDRNPAECAKIPHCDYHCHSARCRDSDIPDEQGCSQYCLNVCGCKQAGCFDQAGVNCRPASGCPFKVARANPKGPPITLRKSNKFPFNLCPDGVTVQRISPKRGDFEYVPVIAVNLGGERHVDEEGWIFEADSNVEFEDPDGIREQAEMPLEEVVGVAEADKPLYATYIKGGCGGGGGGAGSGAGEGAGAGEGTGTGEGAGTGEGTGAGGEGEGGEEKNKVGGPGGEGEVGGKKKKSGAGGPGGEGEGEDENKKGGGGKCLSYVASLCEEGNYLLDLKVVEPEHEKSGDRLFDVRINDVVVLDELNILAWTKMKGRAAEILVRFYYGAGDELVVGGQRANVTDGEIKISFCQSDCPNVTDGGFVASAFQVLHWQRSVNINGRVVSHRGDECRCRILAGKEFSYGTSLCTSPRECSPCAVKSTCMRANAVYVNGGVACKNRFARGSCIVEEVIAAVNMNGRAHQDSRGIRYVADDDILYEDPFRLRYDYDGDILSYGKCPVDVWTRHVVTGVVAADAILYETFTRSYSSGSQGMCMSYNISEKVKTDGKYEMVIKTVEPMYEQPGQRSFSVRLFHDEAEDDKPVLADFDILKFSEPCEATDVVVNFEITDGGSKVVIPGHDPRELTENRMKLGFCLSTCSGNITKSTYDPDFIASAFYIARIADKPEPHIEEHNKTIEAGAAGGGHGEFGEVGGENGKTTKKPGEGFGSWLTSTSKPGGGGQATTTKKPGGGQVSSTKKPGEGFGSWQTSTLEPGGGQATITKKPGGGQVSSTKKPGEGFGSWLTSTLEPGGGQGEGGMTGRESGKITEKPEYGFGSWRGRK